VNQSLRGRAGLLLCGLAACLAARAQAEEAPVVSVTGQVYRDLRAYSHYLPGVREFRDYHALAPDADLRFGLVSGDTGKTLPLKHAALEMDGAGVQLPIVEEGWFTIPEFVQEQYVNGDVVVSWRGRSAVMWVLDVHTPDLPYQVYRVGDLRLECRVYLAIEWAKSRGRRVMGQWRHQEGPKPMNAHCGGTSVFVNVQPWPKLDAYVISEGGRSVRHDMKGWAIVKDSFMLDLTSEAGAPPWSDDAHVEFVFQDRSHWQTSGAAAP
jgi:hypothetical protein